VLRTQQGCKDLSQSSQVTTLTRLAALYLAVRSTSEKRLPGQAWRADEQGIALKAPL
jgi:hypothetical protein